MYIFTEFLIVLALTLVTIEFFIVTGGILAFSGIVCFLMALSLLFLMRPPVSALFLDITVPAFLILASLSVAAVILGYRAQKKKPLIGEKSMIGKKGRCIKPISKDKHGQIEIEGEIWVASSDEEIEKGQKVIVINQDSLKLKVRKEV